jgi:putative copper resistance protein D
VVCLALARGLHVAGSFGVFGTLLLAAFLLPEDAPAALLVGLRRLAWGSLGLAISAGGAWFLLQTADMANAGNLADVLAAMPIVAQSTRFGNLLIFRVVLLVAAGCCWGAGWRRGGAGLAGVAVVAQAWLGHGGAMPGRQGDVLLAASILHLAGGAAWIGSLPALFLAVWRLPAAQAQRLARAYSPLGMVCVGALVLSATVQFVCLIGAPGALFTTVYGRVALVKIAALGGLVGLAARNRARLVPALPAAGPAFRVSICLEIALGLVAVLAAGGLLNLAPPAMAAMLQ